MFNLREHNIIVFLYIFNVIMYSINQNNVLNNNIINNIIYKYKYIYIEQFNDRLVDNNSLKQRIFSINIILLFE